MSQDTAATARYMQAVQRQAAAGQGRGWLGVYHLLAIYQYLLVTRARSQHAALVETLLSVSCVSSAANISGTVLS